MLRKWIKIIFLLVGTVLLVIMTFKIQKPFWREEKYVETVVNFQKNQDILPYRFRTIWWNKTIIVKSIVGRSIDILWSGNYFFLPLVLFIWLMLKKRWWNVGLIILGIILISIEKDPNPGKYLLWLSPLFLSGLIR
ncbi:MAG TPA: hypothetical protein VN174_00955 [Candidatus Methanoperedens sp.]|nr:hypothetical protein [Candidatus Methanoperedens sp.]